MKQVTIYRLDENGKQMELATYTINGSQMEHRGDSAFLERISREGIIDYSSEQREPIFPEQGDKFLEQLPNNFRSGYLMATDVTEVPN
jgi:hypothetical protein